MESNMPRKASYTGQPLKTPPLEVFALTPGSVDAEGYSSEEESVASRISSWSAVREKAEKENSDKTSMTEVKLNEMLKKKPTSQQASKVSSNASVVSTRSERSFRSARSLNKRVSLKQVQAASFRVERYRATGVGKKNRSASFKLDFSSAPAPPKEIPTITESIAHNSIKTNRSALDKKSRKMDDIASKYLFAEDITMDETMSDISFKDGKKNKILYFCYIPTFVAFVLGAFITYVVFYSGDSPQTYPQDQQASEPFTNEGYADGPFLSVEDVMPFLEKISFAEFLNSPGTPQNQALEWLQSKDAVPHGYNSTHQIIQRFILATFFYSTKGSSAWDNINNWLSPTNECSWDGITCFKHDLEFASTSYVAAITLSGKGLSGELPQEIGYLNYLRNLTISGNDIIGSIPSTINKLTNLLTLDLHGNALTGNIPHDMDHLVALKNINLSNNRLKKGLPYLGNIQGLETIDLSNNDLTGIFPYDYTNMEKLKILNLENNNLDGEIPYGIDNMKELKLFNVAYNGFFGTIPDGLANIETLEELHLEGNLFEGEIPAALGHAHSLMTIHFENNALEGTMPPEICSNQPNLLYVDCDSIHCDCCTSCT